MECLNRGASGMRKSIAATGEAVPDRKPISMTCVECSKAGNPAEGKVASSGDGKQAEWAGRKRETRSRRSIRDQTSDRCLKKVCSPIILGKIKLVKNC